MLKFNHKPSCPQAGGGVRGLIERGDAVLTTHIRIVGMI